MTPRRLGRTGLEISPCTLGTAALASHRADRREAGAMIARALERGVNAVELAGGDGRVADLLGSMLARAGARSRVHVFARVTSRVRFDLPSPHIPAQQAYPGRHIRTETEALLRTLGVERLGLQQLHAWCPEWLDEGDWRETLERLREEGKIAGYGISLWDHDLDAAATIVAHGAADSVQLMHNIFDQGASAGLLPFCQRHDVGVIARSPLYFGALGWDEGGPALAPHDWRDGYFYDVHRRETLARVHRLARDVARAGQPLSEIALRFALSHPAVTTVAVGMRTRAQLDANLTAIEGGPLPADEVEALAAHAWLC
ncbi:aldo/keto reductase [Sphingomonas sp. BT-65]|uniref:aldo/keto reductase n=1 Tax=Sphingomonas sp. BT-65 TaxID=2989821 RepID=UPI0022357A98|nr:aldo/keto reductase [Sphingomonas sp. BT-65]MCW4462903.1 aldo/keto reductase [Sphingomonas sp. BT-65]